MNNKRNTTLKLCDVRDALIAKLQNLAKNVSEELALSQPICVTMPEGYHKQIKACQKRIHKIEKKIIQDKNSDMEILKENITAIENTLIILVRQKNDLMPKQTDNDNEVKKYLAETFLRMRAKVVIQRLKQKALCEELNNLNLFFIYGIESLAKKDIYFGQRPHLHKLSFVERENLNKKTAFTLLRLQIDGLLPLLSQEVSAEDLKERFVNVFIKLNDTGIYDNEVNRKKVERLRALAHEIMRQKQAC
jgi:hypothetical protein